MRSTIKTQTIAKLDEMLIKHSAFHADMKIQFDATGDELDFYETEDDDTPGVGTKISYKGDKKATGENLMPDGQTIKYKNGVVTDIISSEEDTEYQSKKRVFNMLSTNGKRIVIYSQDSEYPYMVGNPVTIDGKKLMRGSFSFTCFKILTVDGRITQIDTVETKKKTRKLLK